MKPVEEAYWLSDSWRKQNLRYYPWHGRGYVMLTWRRNYERASREIGVDLLSDPRAAMKPAIAARILVRGMMEGWFTGKSLPQYVNASKKDYRGARRVVNGTDKRDQIAAIANEYEQALDGVYQPGQPTNDDLRLASASSKSPRSHPSQSTTVRASAIQMASGVGGAASSVSMLDGTAQLVALAVFGVIILAAMWIMRERLQKWAAGDR